MNPKAFALRCEEILRTLTGHARHRAFDAACEDALRAAGFGTGVDIFERAVRNWHGPAHPYPHAGPCPDCEVPATAAAGPDPMLSFATLPSRPLLRYLGSKWRLADWIIGHFPAHEIYVEVCGGSGSVLVQKPRCRTEVWNDVDDELVNLFRILRDAGLSAELIRQIALTPYARAEYIEAHQPTPDQVERARRLLIRSHMGHGTRGTRLDRQTGFRSDGMTGGTRVAGEWAEFPLQLCRIAERLRGVSMDNKPAVKLMEYWDAPNVLLYIDPPYLPETRSLKAKQAEGYHAYANEMTVEDHEALLDQATRSRSMVVISGYDSGLYRTKLASWARRSTKARAHRNAPRTEVVWMNTLAAERLAEGSAAGPLFGAAA